MGNELPPTIQCQQPHVPWWLFTNLPECSCCKTFPEISSLMQPVQYPDISCANAGSAVTINNLAGCDGNDVDFNQQNMPDQIQGSPYSNTHRCSGPRKSASTFEDLAELTPAEPHPGEALDTKTAKKRVQNRIAQKTFRKRKQEYVTALEMRIKQLECEIEVYRK